MRTSTGTPASPGELTTTSRRTPARCPLSGSSRCRASDSASGPALPLVVSGSSSARRPGESPPHPSSRPRPCRSRRAGPRPGRRNGRAGRPSGPSSCRPSRRGPSPRGGPSGPPRAWPAGWPGRRSWSSNCCSRSSNWRRISLACCRSVFEGLLLVLCQRPGAEQPVDPLVDGLAPAEQGGLAVALLVVERSGRPSGHLVGDPAGQASLPARPGLARLPGAGQGGGEAGERGAYAERRLEPLGPSNHACS